MPKFNFQSQFSTYDKNYPNLSKKISGKNINLGVHFCFLWVCWFLGKNIFNFVPPAWKPYNPAHIAIFYMGATTKVCIDFLRSNSLQMHLLSVDHFHSSKYGGFVLAAPTWFWWLEMVNCQEVHSLWINFLRNPYFNRLSVSASVLFTISTKSEPSLIHFK